MLSLQPQTEMPLMVFLLILPSWPRRQAPLQTEPCSPLVAMILLTLVFVWVHSPPLGQKLPGDSYLFFWLLEGAIVLNLGKPKDLGQCICWYLGAHKLRTGLEGVVIKPLLPACPLFPYLCMCLFSVF